MGLIVVWYTSLSDKNNYVMAFAQSLIKHIIFSCVIIKRILGVKMWQQVLNENRF
jgi:hypothetical protein